MSKEYDAIIIGSGINALVAGAMLAKKNWSVLICERAHHIGGAIYTSSDTFDGFTVELLSSWHPLFIGGPAYGELAADLAARGVEYVNTPIPTGVICAEGSGIISTDPELNAADFAARGDLDAWNAVMNDFGSKAELAFGLLGTDLWRKRSLKLAWKAFKQLGRRGLVASGAELLEPAAPWLDRSFNSPITRSLLAPWALHNGLGPDDASSAFITKVIGAAIAMGGMPVPVGGGKTVVDAMVAMITDSGGEVRTNTTVTQISVVGGKATGVTTSKGETLTAKKAVLASVTPDALFEKLLPATSVSESRIKSAQQFRFGRAAIQIHIALSEPPAWVDSKVESAALVHVLDGMDSLSESVNAANRGFLPRRPTIVVGQPATVDASRVPEGKGLLWIQLQENPREIRGDLAGEIDYTGPWNEEVLALYTERVIAQLEPHISNIRTAAIGQRVIGPVELQEINSNLVGGDPYAGDCRIDQYALWRPTSDGTGHETGVDRLWQIGASTHPGPGLGGGSGYLVAQRLVG
jgi:phytoene dehydrogenase-like protein